MQNNERVCEPCIYKVLKFFTNEKKNVIKIFLDSTDSENT